MPADTPPVVPTMIEVGARTVNVAYLILSEQVGVPDPASEVEVTLLAGVRFRLRGGEARRWSSALAGLVPGRGAEADDRGTVVRRRHRRSPEKIGE